MELISSSSTSPTPPIQNPEVSSAERQADLQSIYEQLRKLGSDISQLTGRTVGDYTRKAITKAIENPGAIAGGIASIAIAPIGTPTIAAFGGGTAATYGLLRGYTFIKSRFI